MPPKKTSAPAGPSKKTEQKKKDRVIEDKTFGLKNKKGTKQQKYINNVQHQVQYGNNQKAKAADLLQGQRGAKKDAKKKEADELNMLFRPVMETQKLSKGADPKSVLCAFFKQGTCTKGDKCKFSHDLNIVRKAEKRSVYSDVRDDELAKDTMDSWDDVKLQEVVNQKHGEANEKQTKTDIVCKFFIQALENMKYGWFWSCPNGDKCKYRHALPAGFVLKKDKKKMEEQEAEDQISLEELIEEERNKLSGNQLTKITLDSFMRWKKRKIAEKRQRLEDDQAKKRSELKQGKSLGVTGRELFQFKPEMVEEDDDEADVFSYQREEEEEEVIDVQDVSMEAFAAAAMEVDAASAHISTRDLGARQAATNHQQDESRKLNQAAAIVPNDDPTLGATGAAEGVLANGADTLLEDVEVDEDLFGDEIDIDQELDQIDLED